MLMIVGLGNFGSKYANTYHNLGFLAVDKLADTLNIKVHRAECKSLTGLLSLNDEKIVLAKPQTYMNLSGDAVKELLAKYKASSRDMIVIYDDLDLPRFSVRARSAGGPGTHNGARNIVSEIGTQEFFRVRIGIGDSDEDKREYVLSSITNSDMLKFDEVLTGLAGTLKEYIIKRDEDKLLRDLNSKDGIK
ncbi:MAG: aminoacyl-tRNA hydrolase [Christensenellaceae bacterium]|jgi:PTH1 family peptidyl-tRNA hydrolase|nr:aminoacyl-tRNA hydrolase [Christensenellaceae bacterium]